MREFKRMGLFSVLHFRPSRLSSIRFCCAFIMKLQISLAILHFLLRLSRCPIHNLEVNTFFMVKIIIDFKLFEQQTRAMQGLVFGKKNIYLSAPWSEQS